ncbi:MAG: phage tail sheath family protein [Mucilaginibacter sp.]
MSLPNIKTPGVYIDKIKAFSNTVEPVATAVPAFIGYTPQASHDGRSCLNTAKKISSFAEFQAIYCYPDSAAPADPAKQYNPQYYLVQQQAKQAEASDIVINGTYYAITPDPNTIYYLYNSIRLFYQNGGADAYIVSVGTYGAPSGIPAVPGTPVTNPNVRLNDLKGGLALLLNEPEPTMYICPDATLLSVADNGNLMQEMMMQCAQMQTAVSVFDVIGGKNPDPVKYTDDIATFRNNTGSNGLNYGTAYYPFIGTTVMGYHDIDYTNLFGGDIRQLAPVINPASNPDPILTALLNNIQNKTGSFTVQQYNNELINASNAYKDIINAVLADVNLLPPSGAMAGVMTTVDNTRGVWEAPANVSITGVVSLPIKLSESQQANLNMDPVSGKSINAIRSFNGIGILVWGARTLDGNSYDWRYLSVRRTMIFLEQSCKVALKAYVFEPNDKTTWEAVKTMINNFLISIWQQGGLQGAAAPDAFSVDCGLGTTMTTDDILNGFMNVIIKVAVIRPAEFMVITLQQQMAASS